MSYGLRQCEWCGDIMFLRIARDVVRKSFCSHACRQRWFQTFDDRYRANAARLGTLGSGPEINHKKANHGPDHPRWLSDRNLVKYRPRYEGAAWRKAVFERDNYTCQSCGLHGGRLQADHIKSYSHHPEIRWEPSNGRTLCENCHKATDTYGRRSWKSEAQRAV